MAVNVYDFFENLKKEIENKEYAANEANRMLELSALDELSEVARDVLESEQVCMFYAEINQVSYNLIVFYDDLCNLADEIEDAFCRYYDIHRYDERDFKNHIQREIFKFYKSCKFINLK